MIIVAIAVMALAAMIWLRPGDPARPAAGAPAPSIAAAAGPSPSIQPGAAKPAAKKPELPPGLDQLPRSEAVAQLKDALAHYLEFAEYPPWSRPANESQVHVVDWNQSPATGQAFNVDKKGNPISAELKLDKMFAGPGETLTAIVDVWRGSYETTQREPVSAQVLGELQVWREGAGTAAEQPGWVAVHPVSFTTAPGGGGGRYVAHVVPSTVPALVKRAEDVRFVAWVTAEGHKFPFASPFRYAATAPIVVLEGHSDRVVNGSLEVTLALDVRKLGPVMINATLHDAAGTTPIAVYDDYYRPAQLGPQEVKITFFGRILVEKGVAGPYSIRGLHGHVRVDDADPPEVFWAYDKAIPTNAWQATDFAAGEWDSQEKKDKIDQYKSLIADFESGGP